MTSAEVTTSRIWGFLAPLRGLREAPFVLPKDTPAQNRRCWVGTMSLTGSRQGRNDARGGRPLPIMYTGVAVYDVPGTRNISPTTYPTMALSVPMTAISSPLRPAWPTVARAL